MRWASFLIHLQAPCIHPQPEVVCVGIFCGGDWEINGPTGVESGVAIRSINPMHEEHWIKRVWWIAVLGVIYYLAARFGLRFSYGFTHASPVWPSAGLAVAGLLVLGWRGWPGIWLGSILGNIIPWVFVEGSPVQRVFWVSAAIATGATLEALAGWWLARRWLNLTAECWRKEDYFVECSDVFRFAALALLVCVTSALIGPAAICAGGFAPWSRFGFLFTIWWMGDASSILLLTPLLLVWIRPLPSQWNRCQLAEMTAAFTTLGATVWGVFSRSLFAGPSTYPVMVPLVWIALRSSPRVVVNALAFLCAYAIWFTDHHSGPFARPSEQQAILHLMAFIWVTALTAMILASSVAARKKSQSDLKQLSQELETRVKERTTELIESNRALEKESTERANAAALAHRIQERFLRFMEFLPGAAFIKDVEGRYVYANEQMRCLLGPEPIEWLGKADFEVLPQSVAQTMVANDRKVIESGSPLRVVETFPQSDGPHSWLMQKFPLSGTVGNSEAVGGLGVDITDLKRVEERLQVSLERGTVLRREIDHRVKNNLQIITSLLFLQSAQTEDPAMREMLKESQARVRSLSLIYERLCQKGQTAGIPFADYLQQLASEVFSSYDSGRDRISLKISAKEVFLDLDTAIPCGLIVTELISNALKYAFPDSRKGELSIELYPISDDRYCLMVSDNGIGLPKNFKLGMAKSMGMRLVRDLTKQLEGKIEFSEGPGTIAKICFPARLV